MLSAGHISTEFHKDAREAGAPDVLRRVERRPGGVQVLPQRDEAIDGAHACGTTGSEWEN